MKKKLSIYVSSDQHLEKLIHLCRAAKKKHVEVNLFFTHLGVKLTNHPQFGELEGLAKMSLCNMAFEAHKLKKPVPGISDKDFATQERHCRLIEACDRYLAF
jgi:hypothetical protein